MSLLLYTTVFMIVVCIKSATLSFSLFTASLRNDNFIRTNRLPGTIPSRTSAISHPSIALEAISSNLKMQLVAGTSAYGYSGDDGPATSAQINTNFVYVDSNGIIYIPDSSNYRIRRVNSAGIITAFGGTGTSASLGTSGPIGSTSFDSPYSIVGDAAGILLYFCDQKYIWKYLFSTGIITVFAQSIPVVPGFSGDNGPATSAQLKSPRGIWLTTSDILYIVDYDNHRIRKVFSGIITTMAGSGCTNCAGTFSGDGGQATSATLSSPVGVFMDTNGKLFIADTLNKRIRAVETNGIITTFAGSGTATPFNGDNLPKLSANINFPTDVKGDSLGNIYIGDSGNRIIRIVDTSGIISTLFGLLGMAGFTGGLSSRSSRINNPSAIWVDYWGNVYLSDGNSIHRGIELNPTSQPSRQPTRLPTGQPSREPSRQPSSRPTRQPSLQPTSQPTQPTGQPSRQPTSHPTSQPTSRPSVQPSSHPSNQPSSRPSRQPTGQPTHQPLSFPTNQPSSRPTSQPSTKPSSQPLSRPTGSPSKQPSSQPSVQPVGVPSGQPSFHPSRQPTSRPSVQPTNRPSNQPSSRPSRQPSSQPTRQPASFPSNQPSSLPTSQPSTKPSSQPMGIPSGQPSSRPSRQPSVRPSTQPSSQPSKQPSTRPTSNPTSFTKHPSSRPSAVPSRQPSSQPSNNPSSQPILRPTTQPSYSPSCQPTRQPSCHPTSFPSRQPSRQPTSRPTSQPTSRPSVQPSSHPSNQPSSRPSRQPTGQPTHQPLSFPTNQPSSRPTSQPSTKPSSQPLSRPTGSPSKQPSSRPSVQPVGVPSGQPSSHPSHQPTSQPTRQPSVRPSTQPSSQPSKQPSTRPTSNPTSFTKHPSSRPSAVPSSQPSNNPSSQPILRPTTPPSENPTVQPTGFPSSQPSDLPSSSPSSQPTGNPSCHPTTCPSWQPSSCPSSSPSIIPSGEPSNHPTTQPSSFPFSLPTSQPSEFPSSRPTMIPLPTSSPTDRPTAVPSTQPSSEPSKQPTSCPSGLPTISPSSQPTSLPSSEPSAVPTTQPSEQPSGVPSRVPSAQPTSVPTEEPSSLPTSLPSNRPTEVPSVQPSIRPSFQPTSVPTDQPTSLPTFLPSCPPTRVPSVQPTSVPTEDPSPLPSSLPSGAPSSIPSCRPSGLPTDQPSSPPTSLPSNQPTVVPSVLPSSSPTSRPSKQPTMIPTAQPFAFPTAAPAATIYQTNGVLFWLGMTLSTSSVDNEHNNNNNNDDIRGRSFILFGRDSKRKQSHFTSTIDLSSVASREFVSEINKNQGFGIRNDITTRSTTIVGDINGDGFLDLLVGYPIVSKCSVYLGNGVDDFTTIIATTGESFAIIGDPYDGGGFLGWSSIRIGDLNGDGFDEIIVSAIHANTVYVIYGRKDFSKDDKININQLRVNNEGFKITGHSEDINFGVSLTLIHSFRKEGRADLAITAQRAAAGQNIIYILFGAVLFKASASFQNNIEMNQIMNDPIACFKIITPSFSYAGFSVAGIGDINSDGFDDLAIGSLPYSGRGFNEQITYLVFGRPGIDSNELHLSRMTARDGVIITGGGFLVTGVGDLNDDRVDDMMITSYYDWKGQNSAYLITTPTNISYSPSLQPSSFPTFVITDSPTLFNNSRDSFGNATLSPTVVSSFRPTRHPFHKNPTPSPTRMIISRGTARPSLPRPSFVPSLSPTSGYHQLRGFTPTVSPAPTIIETLPLHNSTDYLEIDCPEAGAFHGKNETNYKFIITLNNGTLSLTGQDVGGAKNLYVLYCPTSPVNLAITNFRLSTDIISVAHLSSESGSYPSLNEISYSLKKGPLTLLFCSENKLQVILSSHTSFDLQEKNFLFSSLQSDSENDKESIYRKSVLALVQLGVVSAMFLFLFLIYFALSYQNKLEDNEKKIKFEYLDYEDNNVLIPPALQDRNNFANKEERNHSAPYSSSFSYSSVEESNSFSQFTAPSQSTQFVETPSQITTGASPPSVFVDGNHSSVSSSKSGSSAVSSAPSFSYFEVESFQYDIREKEREAGDEDEEEEEQENSDDHSNSHSHSDSDSGSRNSSSNSFRSL
jgi:hypothetical protein